MLPKEEKFESSRHVSGTKRRFRYFSFSGKISGKTDGTPVLNREPNNHYCRFENDLVSKMFSSVRYMSKCRAVLFEMLLTEMSLFL